MADTFTNGFCLKLEGILTQDQIKQVKDLLYVYTLDYSIEPITTDLIVSDYQLPQAYHIYMASKEQDGKMRPGTKDQYKMCLEKLLFRFCLPLDRYTINHLRLYIQEISVNVKTGKRISTTTLNQRKSIIRSFFRWLYEEEYIQKDPSIRLKIDKSNSKPRDGYKDTQIEALKLACRDLRTSAIVNLLASSGIRVAECAGLNIADVDLVNRKIIVYGKGGKWRTTFINAATVLAIQTYLATRNDTNTALFVSRRFPHDRLSTSAIRKLLHSLQKTSGVDNVIPHRFRYTMATDAIEAGMPIESVQTLLGHSNITTTTHYAKVSTAKVEMDYKKYMK